MAVGRLETLSCSVIRVTRARLKIFCSTASEDVLEKWPLKQIISGEPLKITITASERRSLSLQIHFSLQMNWSEPASMMYMYT